VGKTTTKELAAAVLAQRYKVLKNEGNLNNEIGLPLSLLDLDDSNQRAVLEMGMYGLGEIKALCDIARPRLGVITNVGHSHYERLGSLERIAKAKGELVEALPENGIAILNGDDAFVRALAERTRARVTRYGLDPALEVWASHIESRGLEGISFELHWSQGFLPVRVPLLGRHSVHIALAASAVALAEGFSGEEVARGLASLEARLRIVVTPGLRWSTIIDDTYNASPASTLAALELMRDFQGRRIAVLGDMLELGSYEEEGHRRVGRRAAEVVDRLIVVGERGRIIGEEAQSRGLGAVDFAASNEEAAERLLSLLQPGDYVLIKGSRAMTMEQIVERVKR